MAVQEKYKKNEKGEVVFSYSNISRMGFWEYIWYYPFCLNPGWNFKKRFEDMLIALLFLFTLIFFPVFYPIAIIRNVRQDLKRSKKAMKLDDSYHDDRYKNEPRDY